MPLRAATEVLQERRILCMFSGESLPSHRDSVLVVLCARHRACTAKVITVGRTS